MAQNYNVMIIGNGFDLHHGLPTKFNDFLKQYEKKENIILLYFKKLEFNESYETWINFENEIFEILKFIQKLEDNVSINKSDNELILNKSNIVSTSKEVFIYDFIQKLQLKCFEKSNVDGSIQINIEYYQIWVSFLQESFKKAFLDFVSLFNIYLREYVEDKIIDKCAKRSDRNDCLISEFEQANDIISFNYTSTATFYTSKKIRYVHNKIDDNILVGIPYSSVLHDDFFSFFFKSSQFIVNSKDNVIDYEKMLKGSNVINYTFIGHSFGESDHYLFWYIHDILKNTQRITNTKFKFYCHDKTAKNNYIINMRIFFGERIMMKLYQNNNIKFVNYDGFEC